VNLLLDEGFAVDTAKVLRDTGHDAVHVKEIDMGGATDDQIITEALHRSAVIATHDTDFHQILAVTGADKPSVILLRIEGLHYTQSAALIQQAIDVAAEELEHGAAISINERGIRVRSLPLI